MSQFPHLGLNFMEIGLSLLPGPHSGIHFLRTSGCVPPWQHLKPALKHIFLRKLTRYDCVPYWYILLQICFCYLHWFFYLYHFIVSAVSVTSHNWMLYFNAVSQLYNSYIFHCLVCFICILCTTLENIAVRHYICILPFKISRDHVHNARSTFPLTRACCLTM